MCQRESFAARMKRILFSVFHSFRKENLMRRVFKNAFCLLLAEV